jgi:ribonuclease J
VGAGQEIQARLHHTHTPINRGYRIVIQPAFARIADNDHRHVVLEAGDSVIFSSRIIPGNERAISRLQNKLIALGVEVLTEHDHFVHVSGHPARDELTRMYQMVRPRVAVPVHGELRHMKAHAALAEECQVQQAIVAVNGDMIRLGPLPAAVIGRVPTGRLALDGKELRSLSGNSWKARRRIAFEGVAVATLVLDRDGRILAPPRVVLPGLEEDEPDLLPMLSEAVGRAVAALGPGERGVDATVGEAARLAVRRSLKARTGKRPVIEVQVVRV